MEQVKKFIEKMRGDSALMKKLQAQSTEEATLAELMAIAQEQGFSFTADEFKEHTANCSSCGGCQKTGELSEADLEGVAGGILEYRWDRNVCPTLNRTRFECVGFLQLFWCTFYNRTYHSSTPRVRLYRHVCERGAFNYVGDIMGNRQ